MNIWRIFSFASSHQTLPLFVPINSESARRQTGGELERGDIGLIAGAARSGGKIEVSSNILFSSFLSSSTHKYLPLIHRLD